MATVTDKLMFSGSLHYNPYTLLVQSFRLHHCR